MQSATCRGGTKGIAVSYRSPYLRTGAVAVAIVWLGATACLAGEPAAEPVAGPAVKPTAEASYLRAEPEALEAWKDMRFGMFICWGPVSLTGKEIGWSRGAPPWGLRPGMEGGRGETPVDVYDNLYKSWKPDGFDAREWIRTVREMGGRYIVFLVKHHDGFCLFDSQLTEFKTTGPESAWKIDVFREVVDACHAMDVKVVVYYSQPDWHHTDYRGPNHSRYIEYFHGQIREILTNYGRIDGLWFDLGGSPKDWDSEKLFAMARGLQPWLVINNRCGLSGDFDTPEQYVGRTQFDRPWESCITLGTQWSWKPDDTLKSADEAIRMLVACAVGDGNMALNTNPMPDGRMEPRQVESFRSIGRWLAEFGESIYGTRGGPFRAPEMGARTFGQDALHFAMPQGRWWGGATCKGNTIYLHILRWPSDTIQLQELPRKIVGHKVLTGGTATVAQTADGITVTVPLAERHPIDTIVKLELDGPARGLTLPPPASGSLATGKPASASNFHQKMAEYAPCRAVDDDPNTRWGCDWGTKSAWLAVDLAGPGTFAGAYISEPYGRVQKFELQCRDREDEAWRTFHHGTTIGEDHRIAFPPVTARYVRLNLLETTEGPSIWEFQLLPAESPADANK